MITFKLYCFTNGMNSKFGKNAKVEIHQISSTFLYRVKSIGDNDHCKISHIYGVFILKKKIPFIGQVFLAFCTKRSLLCILCFIDILIQNVAKRTTKMLQMYCYGIYWARSVCRRNRMVNISYWEMWECLVNIVVFLHYMIQRRCKMLMIIIGKRGMFSQYCGWSH